MYGVKDNPAGQAWYDSLFRMYASWGVDFVKVDDLSNPYSAHEVEMVRKAIDKCGRPMVFSTSPGETPVNQMKHVAAHANMWRLSEDFWDKWQQLTHAFNLAEKWQGVGGPGHWPDLDMLQLGRLGTRCIDGARMTRFTRDEQRTHMTLWCVTRSPLMFGGDLTHNDAFTDSLLTNDEVLTVNQRSTGNRQLYRRGNEIAWTADVRDSKDRYLALFNLGDTPVMSFDVSKAKYRSPVVNRQTPTPYRPISDPLIGFPMHPHPKSKFLAIRQAGWPTSLMNTPLVPSTKSRWLPLVILSCLVNILPAATDGLFTYTDNGTTITITDYPTDAAGELVIPATIIGKPVTSIGDSAFASCYKLTKVTIPSSVDSIGDSAFYDCYGLTSVTVSSGVDSIGNSAFYYCSGLTSVTISTGVASIGYSAFYGCNRLTSVTIPSSVSYIGYTAFQNCGSLASATFIGNAPVMGNRVFDNAASEFTIYYFTDRAGFATPLWFGYPTVNMGEASPLPPYSSWHFGLAGGRPHKLVWQSSAALNYDLWFSSDMSGWTHVDGFPKPSAGGAMEHRFAAGPQGFYWIKADDGFALIPAGSFQMGDQSSPLVGSSNELPVHTVQVSTFYMAKYEVTKVLWDEVRAWGLLNGYTDLPVGSWNGTANFERGADHPVQIVGSWDTLKWCNARSQKDGLTPCYYLDDSQTSIYKTGLVNITNAMVKWGANGYRLPTEAEWEKAARGGLEGKNFPWGDTITHSQANYYSSNSYVYDVSPTRGWHPTYSTGSSPYTSPVGSFEPNGYGVYDMAGNVVEGCWDNYSSSYYASSPGTDPHGPPYAGSGRVFRGGRWGGDAKSCRIAFRFTMGGGTDSGVGFRVARSTIP